MKSIRTLKSLQALSVLCTTTMAGCAPQLDQDAPAKDEPTPGAKAPASAREHAAVADFLNLLTGDRAAVNRGLQRIENGWHPGNRVMLIEVLRFVRQQSTADRIFDLLRRQTGRDIGPDMGEWYREIWQTPYDAHPDYASFKAQLYEPIDSRFREYFVKGAAATIRLDEIRWGGVRRDGIPPLKDPETLSADEAAYLADTDIVFGVEVNGQTRAYPKRILAWHEMVKDVVGGESINGVYCTLCGSMIVYKTISAGKHYELGTSGFLYRSNKLMYDAETKSLWSTIKGKPVVGELVGNGINLQSHYVVTTTWGQWKSMHPETRVLSLNTGHRRDYGEGVAYRDYFATDDLMFEVPQRDRRLKNKDEVFVIREHEDQPLAIGVDFLRKHPVYHGQIDDIHFVVITDETGANRAYQTDSRTFERLGRDGRLYDADGRAWTVTPAALVSPDGRSRHGRLPAHRAFWFGWFAAHPNTRLIK